MGLSVTLKVRCWPPGAALDKVGAGCVIPRRFAMTTSSSAPHPLDAAIREHNALLAASGVGLRLERRTLWVAARTRYDTLFLRLAGIPTVTLGVEGRAYAAFGIHREGQ